MASRQAEKTAIRDAILAYYHEGHVKNDAELYTHILHPEWRFLLLDAGTLRIVDRPEFLTWYDVNKADPTLEWETEFFYVDVTEHLAAVKLRLECQKVRYIDCFNMMKLDGTWWIVHKMSCSERKESQQ
jgi:hypothetical protein